MLCRIEIAHLAEDAGLEQRPQNFTPEPAWNLGTDFAVLNWAAQKGRTEQLIALLANGDVVAFSPNPSGACGLAPKKLVAALPKGGAPAQGKAEETAAKKTAVRKPAKRETTAKKAAGEKVAATRTRTKARASGKSSAR